MYAWPHISRAVSGAVACAVWIAAGAVAAPRVHAAVATDYHVDCAAHTNGNGSVVRPFNNLADVNALTLHAGDRVLFKRGTTCRGTLAPRGSGAAGAPIVIGAYGSGPKPAIDAGGRTQAVLLQNEGHIHVSDLDLSAPGNNTAVRRGIYVYARNAGSVSGITLEHLTIHDVRGLLPEHGGSLLKLGAGKYAGASGGIIVEAAGSRVPTAFNDLHILDNTIRNVDREGIYLWSNWCRRPQLASGWHPLCTAKWDPATHVVIRGNHLADIGGDGIAPMTSRGVLVEANTLDGFNMRGHGYNAGMWTANSDDVVFQHNVVTGGHSTRDGMAYDVDNSTAGVMFQYNLSYANAGGFFLLCPWNTPVRNFTIRYNISLDDHARGFEVCDGALQNGRIDHNTIYIGDGVSQQIVEAKTRAPLHVRFVDNIVDRSNHAGKVGWTLSEPPWVIDHNDFHNVSVPAWATATVTGDPRFADPGSFKPDGYRLLEGSAALGSGISIPDDGGCDFFGNTIVRSQLPNMGAYAGKAVCTHADGASCGASPSGHER